MFAHAREGSRSLLLSSLAVARRPSPVVIVVLVHALVLAVAAVLVFVPHAVAASIGSSQASLSACCSSWPASSGAPWLLRPCPCHACAASACTSRLRLLGDRRDEHDAIGRPEARGAGARRRRRSGWASAAARLGPRRARRRHGASGVGAGGRLGRLARSGCRSRGRDATRRERRRDGRLRDRLERRRGGARRCRAVARGAPVGRSCRGRRRSASIATRRPAQRCACVRRVSLAQRQPRQHDCPGCPVTCERAREQRARRSAS